MLFSPLLFLFSPPRFILVFFDLWNCVLDFTYILTFRRDCSVKALINCTFLLSSHSRNVCLNFYCSNRGSEALKIKIPNFFLKNPVIFPPAKNSGTDDKFRSRKTTDDNYRSRKMTDDNYRQWILRHKLWRNCHKK